MQITKLSSRYRDSLGLRKGLARWPHSQSVTRGSLRTQNSSAFVQIPYCLPFQEGRAVIRHHAEGISTARAYRGHCAHNCPAAVLALVLSLTGQTPSRRAEVRRTGVPREQPACVSVRADGQHWSLSSQRQELGIRSPQISVPSRDFWLNFVTGLLVILTEVLIKAKRLSFLSHGEFSLG